MDHDIRGWLERVDRNFRTRRIEASIERRRALVAPGTPLSSAAAQEAIDLLQAGQMPGPELLRELAACIRLLREPLFTRRGEIWDPPAADPTLLRWRPEGWDRFCRDASPLVKAVCRIDRIHPGLEPDAPVGTGFLVAPGVIATARHVLAELSNGVCELERGMARAWFGHEFQTENTREPVDLVGVVAQDRDLDIALLRLDGHPAGIDPLRFRPDRLDPGLDVAIVGYPNQDSRDRGMGATVFGQPYGCRRVSPGEITERWRQADLHDCATLGGNSGSPVFSVADGLVVGLHLEGQTAWFNELRPTPLLKAHPAVGPLLMMGDR